MKDGQLIADGSVTWRVVDTRGGGNFPTGLTIHDWIVREGFVKANGNEVSREEYKNLFNWANSNGLILAESTKLSNIKYRTFYGSGNGTTTFTLPDERGIFVRGWDDGRLYDTGRELGTYQEDAIRNIYGVINRITNAASFAGTTSGVFKGVIAASHSYPAAYDASNYATNYDYVEFRANYLVPTTTTDTRVKNVAKIAQIKY